MKLSCLPVSFFQDIITGRMSVLEWAQLGASLGLDGIDISILFVKETSAEYLATMRAEVESTGLGIIMVNQLPGFHPP